MKRILALAVVVFMTAAACASDDATDASSPTTELGEATASSIDGTEATATNVDDPVSTTTEAASTTTAKPAGTLDDPLPGGEFGQVGDWNVRVIDVNADATEIVLEENQFNDPPTDGNQFFMATLEAEYVGDESGQFWIDMTWKAVGPSAVAYEEFEASCGVFTDSISDTGETFPGGIVSGNVCWSVSADDAEDLVMLLDSTFSFDDSERAGYQLDPEMVTIDASESASADLSQVPALALGESAHVGDWAVSVVDVNADATEIVLEENQFNDPPTDGNQFFMATLEAEYVGDESGQFWIDMTWKAVGPSAVAYEEFEASCGVFTDSISDTGETFPGGIVSGNVCWSVSADDAEDLVMLLDSTFSFDDSERAAYRLVAKPSE